MKKDTTTSAQLCILIKSSQEISFLMDKTTKKGKIFCKDLSTMEQICQFFDQNKKKYSKEKQSIFTVLTFDNADDIQCLIATKTKTNSKPREATNSPQKGEALRKNIRPSDRGRAPQIKSSLPPFLGNS